MKRFEIGDFGILSLARLPISTSLKEGMDVQRGLQPRLFGHWTRQNDSNIQQRYKVYVC